MSKGIPGVKHYASKVMKYERGGSVGSVDDSDEGDAADEVEGVPAVSKTATGARLEVAHRNFAAARARDMRNKKRDD